MNKLPKKLSIYEDDFYNKNSETYNDLCDAINEYLSEKYGYCTNSWCLELKVSEIEWDLEEK